MSSMDQGGTETTIIAVGTRGPDKVESLGKATVMWDQCHGDTVTVTYHSPARLRHLGKFTWSSSHTEKRKKESGEINFNVFYSAQ